MLMSVPGGWSTVTPPMFPCVCDGITFEREGTRIREGEKRGGSDLDIGGPLQSFFRLISDLFETAR